MAAASLNADFMLNNRRVRETQRGLNKLPDFAILSHQLARGAPDEPSRCDRSTRIQFRRAHDR